MCLMPSTMNSVLIVNTSISSDAKTVYGQMSRGLDNMNAPAALRVCRICLCMEGKLYDMKDYELYELYQILTDTEWSEKDGLPQRLCWECAARLVSFSRFGTRAVRSHQILTNMLRRKAYLTMEDIKSVNRTHNYLNSDLVQRVLQPINCVMYDGDEVKQVNLHSNDNDDDVKPVYLDSDDEYLRNDDYSDVGVKLENSLVMSKEETPPSLLPEIEDDTSAQSMNAENEEYYYVEYLECDDADDNAVISALTSEEISEPEKKKSKLKQQNKEEKQKKVTKQGDMRKGIEKNVKKSGVDNLNKIIAKYKTADVRKRNARELLDESLFDIIQSSYEEQIEEIQKRQETSPYKNASYKCNLCFKSFQTLYQSEVHAARHSDASGAFECFICKKRLISAATLRKHLTSLHTEKISCKLCKFVTRSRGSARAHQKWHAGTKYQCSRCSKEFHNRSSYLGHVRLSHVSDFVCELCGYTFLSKYGVEVHKNIKHKLVKGNVPLEGPHCSECDVTFVSEEAYSRHLKLSSKHITDDHPNRIRNDSQYQGPGTQGPPRERRRETNAGRDKHVACEECGDIMRNSRVYAQHFRRVHPDKILTKNMNGSCMCEHCGRICKGRTQLEDHMWIHTGERPFKCDHCDKRFVHKANLKVHLKVHSAKRERYECPQCHKQFAFYRNRERHMFIHTGLKPFKCVPCGKSFTTVSQQRAHVDHVHLKKPWPKRKIGPRIKDAKQKKKIKNED